MLLFINRPYDYNRRAVIFESKLLKNPNFFAGSLLMFTAGMILSGSLVLVPSMMQDLPNYPVFDAGWKGWFKVSGSASLSFH